LKRIIRVSNSPLTNENEEPMRQIRESFDSRKVQQQQESSTTAGKFNNSKYIKLRLATLGIKGKWDEMKIRKSQYSAEEQIELERLIGNIKRHIRESFTLKKLINPGWKQWGIRIACFGIVHFRHGLHRVKTQLLNDRGDVPGWVLVVLMTTGLVTAIWTLAAPRIQSILRTSLDSMNNIR